MGTGLSTSVLVVFVLAFVDQTLLNLIKKYLLVCFNLNEFSSTLCDTNVLEENDVFKKTCKNVRFGTF